MSEQLKSAMPLTFNPARVRIGIIELARLVIVEHDAEMRFRLRMARGRGRTERGLALLAKAGARPAAGKKGSRSPAR